MMASRKYHPAVLSHLIETLTYWRMSSPSLKYAALQDEILA
jgi:hypothetical protein